MKALTLDLESRELRLSDRPEPGVSAPDGVKLRVIECGICGTDREEVAGGYGRPPPGGSELVLGHEMLGTIVETGPAVRGLKNGDLAVVSVRRPCSACLPCSLARPDMCTSGDYLERGIRRADGFQAEFVSDTAVFVTRLPDSMVSFGVLCEPASIAEKAVSEAITLQRARLPSAPGDPYVLQGRDAMVAGLGAVGLLAALRLVLLGARVWGLDVVDDGDARVKLLQRLGGTYVRSRGAIDTGGKQFDIIVEATGVPSVQFGLMRALSPDGIFAALGIPKPLAMTDVPAGELFRSLVLGNNLVLGSVNAGIEHMRAAAGWLEEADGRWPGLPASIISRRLPVDAYIEAFERRDDIKTTIRWSDG
jgi:threonine dehydrogenase-like Zn-dependent dehydrogenase